MRKYKKKKKSCMMMMSCEKIQYTLKNKPTNYILFEVEKELKVVMQTLIVAWKGKKWEFVFEPTTTTVWVLKKQVEEKTGVPVSGQKILWPRRQKPQNEDFMVSLSLKNPQTVIMMGLAVREAENFASEEYIQMEIQKERRRKEEEERRLREGNSQMIHSKQQSHSLQSTQRKRDKDLQYKRRKKRKEDKEKLFYV